MDQEARAQVIKRPPKPLVFTRDSIRKLDRLAVEQYNIPSIVLMENASHHIAAAALNMVRRISRPRIIIYCGPGNNGGDGLAAARHLHNAGARVSIILSGPASRYSGDAAINVRIAQRMKLPVRAAGRGKHPPCDLIIDALLGTGLDRPVTGVIARLIDRINRQIAPVLAVDIPSGLDADTGKPLGAAIRATHTLTLAGLKLGFLNPAAREYLGKVSIGDIGIPRELAERLAYLSRN